MDEYIRKEDALNAISCDITITGRENAETVCKAIASFTDGIKALEPADVAPVVHSRWEYKCGEIQCPECGNRIHRIDLSGCLNFCPNCGAKMDGEK